MFLRLLLGFILTTAVIHAEDTGHPLRGVVTRKIEDRKLVMVKHEAIPGFMRAMTMAFSVSEADWPKLEPGAHLTATLRGGRGNWRLSDIVLTDENYAPLPVVGVATSASASAVAPGPAVTAAYPLKIDALASPAPTGASVISLFRGANGTIGIGWIESASEGSSALRCALFNPTDRTWSAPATVATGADWVVSDLNCPQFALAADGSLTVVWFVNNPSTGAHEHGHLHAKFSHKAAGTTAWSEPAPLSRENRINEFAAVTALADGRVLAVWLDGRAKHTDGQTQRLYGRVLGTDGPDQLIDDSACACCPTTLTAFPNGDALVAYRARREGNVRDIHTSVFREGQWGQPRILSADDWTINGCPVNGPQLDSNAGQVGVTWFTGADGSPKVLASASPDAGARFLMPQRIDLGHPLGQADVVLLHDGSRLVTWLEGGDQPGLWLRCISAQDALIPAVRLAVAATGRPQIALLKDYDATPAQLLVAFANETEDKKALTILLATLPDLSTLAGRAPCLPCDEHDANATRGYGVKGVITGLPDAETVTLQFDEIPGVMRAGSLACKVNPGLHAELPVGQGLLGRIEQRDGVWWLFSVKRLGATHR